MRFILSGAGLGPSTLRAGEAGEERPGPGPSFPPLRASTRRNESAGTTSIEPDARGRLLQHDASDLGTTCQRSENLMYSDY